MITPEKEPAPLNILFADDDADDRFFFDKALKEIDIITSLTTVNDGQLLMNYLCEDCKSLPDVLFLDLNMPRKNGYECLSELKQNVRLKNIPVIVFTTSCPNDSVVMLFKVGAQDFVRKSGDFEQLKLVIHQALIRAIAKSSFSKEVNSFN
jgi:CheY-like chemotaxis protein